MPGLTPTFSQFYDSLSFVCSQLPSKFCAGTMNSIHDFVIDYGTAVVAFCCRYGPFSSSQLERYSNRFHLGQVDYEEIYSILSEDSAAATPPLK
jgi:hypothetical protein